MACAAAHDSFPVRLVTMKRGLSLPPVISALPMTLRSALQPLGHDGLQCCESALAGITVRSAQLGPQRNIPAKTVERQITVMPVVAVEKAPLLRAVQRVVGGIKVQHDDLALLRDGLNTL